MHSEQEIRQAAERAGCRVLELRRVDTQFGPAWWGKHSCPDNPATFKFLLEIAKLDVTDPLARSVALGICGKFGAKNQERIARAVQEWTKKNVRYIKEPKETFQSPTYTIRSRHGDCDDHANLTHAILRNCNIEARIVPLSKGGQVRHAVTQVSVGGTWHWLETTVDAAFGEEPRAAVRRLKLGGRGDIAA